MKSLFAIFLLIFITGARTLGETEDDPEEQLESLLEGNTPLSLILIITLYDLLFSYIEIVAKLISLSFAAHRLRIFLQKCTYFVEFSRVFLIIWGQYGLGHVMSGLIRRGQQTASKLSSQCRVNFQTLSVRILCTSQSLLHAKKRLLSEG